jgi:hypothetical protein
MNGQDHKLTTNRRDFLGTIAMGAGALTMASLTIPAQLAAHAKPVKNYPEDPEEWFKKINGKHRIVFDVTQPNSVLPFVWPRVFLMTNQQTGATQKDCNEVVILRHEAIPYAFDSSLWEKYKLGEFAKITDPKTNGPSVRNMFWQPQPGDFAVPGIGNVQIGINELQDNGVMFGVCSVAILVNSHAIAQKMNADPDTVQKDLIAGILPGIQLLPSGVWAVGRAQEHGCAYCFAG